MFTLLFLLAVKRDIITIICLFVISFVSVVIVVVVAAILVRNWTIVLPIQHFFEVFLLSLHPFTIMHNICISQYCLNIHCMHTQLITL